MGQMSPLGIKPIYEVCLLAHHHMERIEVHETVINAGGRERKREGLYCVMSADEAHVPGMPGPG